MSMVLERYQVTAGLETTQRKTSQYLTFLLPALVAPLWLKDND